MGFREIYVFTITVGRIAILLFLWIQNGKRKRAIKASYSSKDNVSRILLSNVISPVTTQRSKDWFPLPDDGLQTKTSFFSSYSCLSVSSRQMADLIHCLLSKKSIVHFSGMVHQRRRGEEGATTTFAHLLVLLCQYRNYSNNARGHESLRSLWNAFRTE